MKDLPYTLFRVLSIIAGTITFSAAVIATYLSVVNNRLDTFIIGVGLLFSSYAFFKMK